jgi:hypothetical protein
MNSSNYRTVYVNCPSEFEYLNWYKIQYDMSPAVFRRVSETCRHLRMCSKSLHVLTYANLQQRLAIEEVLSDASEHSKEVILVYASDDAIEDREIILPSPLQTFIELDNQAFKDEQAVQEAQLQAGGYTGQSTFENDSPIDEDPPPYDDAPYSYVDEAVGLADDPIRAVGESSGAAHDSLRGTSAGQDLMVADPEDQDRHLW